MANMLCPKCGLFQEKADICNSCGVIIAKLTRQQRPVASEKKHDDVHVQVDTVSSPSIKEKLFFINHNEDMISVSARGLVLLGMLVLSFKLITSTIASNYVGDIFLHGINLPFHEAGHVVFRIFGSFMASLGGTLGQFIMPAICFYTFLYRMLNPFAAAVCLWWIGENFLDIAPYINDARAGELPLLGGNFGHSSPYGFHDWEYLLTESGLIRHDHTIANLSFFIGSVMMLLALVWGGIVLYRQYKVAISK